MPGNEPVLSGSPSLGFHSEGGEHKGGDAPARGSGMEEPGRDSSPVPSPTRYKGLCMSLQSQWAV